MRCASSAARAGSRGTTPTPASRVVSVAQYSAIQSLYARHAASEPSASSSGRNGTNRPIDG